MPWFRLDDGLDEHEKVESLLDADELRGLAAIGLLTLMGTGTSRRMQDGRVTTRQVAKLAPEHGVELAQRLAGVELLDRDGDAWQIHDFLDYNPSREKVLSDRDRRSAAAAKANAVRWAKEDGADSESDPAPGRISAVPSDSDRISDVGPPVEGRLSDSDRKSDPTAESPRSGNDDPPVPARPVPIRESVTSANAPAGAGVRAPFAGLDPLATLDGLPDDHGNRKFQGAWPMEKVEVLGLLAAEPIEVQRLVAERVIAEAPRWAGHGVKHWVETEFVPQCRRAAEKAAAVPTAAALAAERRQRAAGMFKPTAPAYDFEAEGIEIPAPEASA